MFPIDLLILKFEEAYNIIFKSTLKKVSKLQTFCIPKAIKIVNNFFIPYFIFYY